MKTSIDFDIDINTNTCFFIPTFAMHKEEFDDNISICFGIMFLCFCISLDIERIDDDYK